MQQKKAEKFHRYKDDPVGFCTEIIGDMFTDEAIQVMESVRDNPITVVRSANGVGKSHVAARISTWFFATRPRAKVFITAAQPLENLKQILWGEVLTIARHRPEVFSGSAIKRLWITRNSESFIAGLSIPTAGSSEEREARFSGKHAPNMLFVVDEGDAVPDEVYRGIESCMSGGEVRLLIMFNPRARIGPVYEMEKNRQANVVHMSAMTHPNVVTGIDSIPGAVSREITVRRINMWTREIGPYEVIGEDDNDIFTVPDFLVGETAKGLDGVEYPPLPPGKRRIIDSKFSYMCLGLYPVKGTNQLILEEWVDNARSRWDAYVAKFGEKPPPDTSGIIGFDMAEFGTDSNVIVKRFGGFVQRPITWSGVDPYESAMYCLKIYTEDGNISVAHVDAMGVGAGAAPLIARQGREKNVRAVGIRVSEKPTRITKEKGEFYQLRDQLWWAVREWLKTDTGAMLPPDQYLKEELLAPTYDDKDGKIRVTSKEVLRKLLKRSPDRADALCLTFSPYEKAKIIRLSD
jgi:hypothetical protein